MRNTLVHLRRQTQLNPRAHGTTGSTSHPSQPPTRARETLTSDFNSAQQYRLIQPEGKRHRILITKFDLEYISMLGFQQIHPKAKGTPTLQAAYNSNGSPHQLPTSTSHKPSRLQLYPKAEETALNSHEHLPAAEPPQLHTR